MRKENGCESLQLFYFTETLTFFYQAVYTWFKNNKPFEDRQVFRLERKIPL